MSPDKNYFEEELLGSLGLEFGQMVWLIIGIHDLIHRLRLHFFAFLVNDAFHSHVPIFRGFDCPRLGFREPIFKGVSRRIIDLVHDRAIKPFRDLNQQKCCTKHKISTEIVNLSCEIPASLGSGVALLICGISESFKSSLRNMNNPKEGEKGSNERPYAGNFPLAVLCRRATPTECVRNDIYRTVKSHPIHRGTCNAPIPLPPLPPKS